MRATRPPRPFWPAPFPGGVGRRADDSITWQSRPFDRLRHQTDMVILAATILAVAAMPMLGAEVKTKYYAHSAVHDQHGVIAPWYKGQNGQCDFRLRVAGRDPEAVSVGATARGRRPCAPIMCSTGTGRSRGTAQSPPSRSRTGITATWASVRRTCWLARCEYYSVQRRSGGHRHHDDSRPTRCWTIAAHRPTIPGRISR